MTEAAVNGQTRRKLCRCFSVQLYALASLLLVSAFALFAWYTLDENDRQVGRFLEQQADSVAENIAARGAKHISRNDLASLQELLLQYRGLPNIISIKVLDREQNVIGQVQSNRGFPMPRAGREKNMPTPPDTWQKKSVYDGELLYLWEPIHAEDFTGWVNIVYSQKALFMIRKETLESSLIGLLAAVLATLLALHLYLRRPLRAITQATRFAARLGDNSGHQIASDAGTEEIMQLQQALNHASTQLHNHYQALSATSGRLQTVLNSAGDGIITLNEQGLIESFNPAAEVIFGYTATDIIGRKIGILIPPHSGQAGADPISRLLEKTMAGACSFRQELAGVRKNGASFSIELALSECTYANQRIFTVIVRDISIRKRNEEQLSYLANYDILTGLPNRILLYERIKQAKIEADRHERMTAIMFIDLDRFKIINDSLGHGTGDQLLVAIARRLEEVVRPGDSVARIGGDEFGIVLANIAHINDVARMAEKIMGRLNIPVSITGRNLYVTASIGVVLYPFDDKSTDDLLRDADAAMYLAKENGGNNHQFYTAELNTRTSRRLGLESSLRQALAHNELSLHYQPQVDLRTGHIIGAEALLRWDSAEWGQVSPAEFIPIAEDTGLILTIGRWAIRCACRQNKAWQKMGLPPMRMTVNISSRQFRHQDLPLVIAEELVDSGLTSEYFGIEITESAIMQDTARAIATIVKLSEMGLAISVDDFGTGYSSLSYLKRFPIDTLKIDKSFVDDVTLKVDDAAIVRAIIVMSHSLNIRVIAEGVETHGQMAFLRANHCDGMQGYYFSKPLPADAFTRLLKENRSMKLDDLPEPVNRVVNMPRKA